MQEEVNERVVLVIKGGVTLSARALAKAMRKEAFSRVSEENYS